MPNEIQIEYNLKFKGLMKEGMKKYKRIIYDPYAPSLKLSLPEIFINSSVKMRCLSFLGGKVKVHEGSGEYRAVLEICRKIKKKRIKILDIGCASCDLADYLQNGHGLEIDYFGVDISSDSKEYPVVKTIDEIEANDFDVIVMTHVAEHLKLDDYIENYQKKLAEKLRPGGYFIFAVPNPLNVKNNLCDMTHIQIFPWYEAYAMLRFSFSKVDVSRLENLNNLFDIFFLPLRMFACRLVYLDTAKSLVFICEK
jgi:SAM-dependent methyltransferase